MLDSATTKALTTKLLSSGIADTVAWIHDHTDEEALIYLHGSFPDAYTGEALAKLIQSKTAYISSERDFVRHVVDYFNDDSDYLLSVKGLRSTGKTVGLLQALARINDHSNSVYIEVKKDLDYTMDALLEFIKQYKGKRYIVIDEITYAHNFISDNTLSTLRAAYDMRIVIAGTNSVALNASAETSEFHRTLFIDTSFISYAEAAKTQSLSLSQYLTSGGIYVRGFNMTNEFDALKYIDTAIISCAEEALAFNTSHVPKTVLDNYDGDIVKLRTVVFNICYVIIYTQKYDIGSLVNLQTISSDVKAYLSRVTSKNCFNYKEFIGLFTTGAIFITSFLKELEALFNINTNYIPDEVTVVRTLNFLMQLGIVSRLVNFANDLESSYYITNPVIFYKLYSHVASQEVIQFEEKVTHDNLCATQGKILEAVVVKHLQYYSGTKLYMYETTNEELDCVLVYNDDTCKAIEVKAYTDVKAAISKSLSLQRLEHSYHLRYSCTEKILVCYTQEEQYVLADNKDTIHVIPADKFLLDVNKYI